MSGLHRWQCSVLVRNSAVSKGKKCIKMGITVLKIVIWGGKSSVLWLQIAFYGSAGCSSGHLLYYVTVGSVHLGDAVLGCNAPKFRVPDNVHCKVKHAKWKRFHFLA